MKIEKFVKERIKQFKRLGKEGKAYFDFNPFADIEFKASIKGELLFCISTAFSKAISGLLFQREVEKILKKKITREEIEKLLKESKVRFYKSKSYYMINAIKNFSLVEKVLEKESKESREVLVKNFKGIGYKEGSHFLRNVGREDVAIIDRHILRWLKENGYVSKVKKLNKRSYLKIEKILEKIAYRENLTLASLDLLLWYEKTGAILK